jgi:hypothetical protein
MPEREMKARWNRACASARKNSWSAEGGRFGRRHGGLQHQGRVGARRRRLGRLLLRGDILRPFFPRRFLRICFGKKGLQRRVAAGQAGPREQSRAGLRQFGAQKAARIETRGGEIAIAAGAEPEAGQRDKAQSFVFCGHRCGLSFQPDPAIDHGPAESRVNELR